jgi:hypothetical protein
MLSNTLRAVAVLKDIYQPDDRWNRSDGRLKPKDSNGLAKALATLKIIDAKDVPFAKERAKNENLDMKMWEDASELRETKEVSERW